MTEIMTHIRQLNDDYFDGKLSPAVVDLLANMPQKNKEAWSKAGYNA